MWVFPKIGVPENGWFIVENPIKYHYFWKYPCFKISKKNRLDRPWWCESQLKPQTASLKLLLVPRFAIIIQVPGGTPVGYVGGST